VIVAHIGGVPVEETLLWWAPGGAGAGLLLARTWIASFVRSRRGDERR
jgi:hypothetical protein